MLSSFPLKGHTPGIPSHAIKFKWHYRIQGGFESALGLKGGCKKQDCQLKTKLEWDEFDWVVYNDDVIP